MWRVALVFIHKMLAAIAVTLAVFTGDCIASITSTTEAEAAVRIVVPKAKQNDAALCACDKGFERGDAREVGSGFGGVSFAG